MSPREVIALFRSTVDDLASDDENGDTDYLWSDIEVLVYLNIAYRAFCRDTAYLIDSSTADICTKAFSADDTTIALSPLVIDVRDAYLVGYGQLDLLKLASLAKNTCYSSDYGVFVAKAWQERTATRPSGLVTDMDIDTARLYPIPSTGGTVQMTVVRYPVADVTTADLDTTDFFEVTEPEYQMAFVQRMAAEAYLKNDTATYDPQAAERALAVFNQKTEDARVSLKQRRKSAS